MEHTDTDWVSLYSALRLVQFLKKQIKGKLRRSCEDLGALVLRVGAAWCSDLRSIIDSRTNLRVECNEGQSVSVCSVYSPTTSFFPSATSLQGLFTLFHIATHYNMLTHCDSL